MPFLVVIEQCYQPVDECLKWHQVRVSKPSATGCLRARFKVDHKIEAIFYIAVVARRQATRVVGQLQSYATYIDFDCIE